MFRRLYSSASAACRTSVSLASFTSSKLLFAEQDPVEREREKELRQQVMQKYKGMQIPEMTNFEYGHFSTGGIQAAAAQQAMSSQGLSGLFGGWNNATNSSSNSNSTSGGTTSGSNGSGDGFNGGMPNMQMPPFFKIDWLMLFTGAALMYVSGKILYNQMTRGVNDLDFPLWTASIEVQAQHLLFCVQYDEKDREEMKREFQVIRQTNPFADFFQWVRSRHPEFGCGNRTGADTNTSVLVGALSSTNSRELMALATALRQSLGRRGGDPLTRMDAFVSKLLASGTMLGGGLGSMGGMSGLGATSSPVPPYMPPHSTHQQTFDPPQIPNEAGTHATNPFERMETKE